eukprot:CAMPEP_0197183884 /NCGR_PEP_ID=MMETSP1423-20130617/8681_1 /TAXON_ID=476441 /ORGANISM="Pseudo-nitzschia heimii, Strain UNC1101" /LENGTH=241 /DNA_ID=CAMNT_0042634543 /DNA_START=45 /DNA_END=770 /DNA_ORIENTATION=-
MKNIASSVKQRDVAKNPQNLRLAHHRDNDDSQIQRFHRGESNRGESNGVRKDITSFTGAIKSTTNNRAKHNQENKRKKHHAERDLTVSMRNLSLDIDTIPVAKAVKKEIEISSYIRRNIVTWTERVFAKVGPHQKEIKYHIELKNMLLSKSLDVGYEVPLRFERFGSKPIAKRVDLIASLPGVPQKVLIECKAKKKLEKKDYEQVLFYQHHFGIRECYLINFRIGTEVRRLKHIDSTFRKI